MFDHDKRNSEQDIINYLQNHNTSINIKKHFLFESIDEGYIDATKLLIDHIGIHNTENYQGNTALHHAIDHERVEIAQYLIEHGIDVNVKDNQGLTPLNMAFWPIAGSSINTKIVRLLLDSTIDPNSEIDLNNINVLGNIAFNTGLENTTDTLITIAIHLYFRNSKNVKSEIHHLTSWSDWPTLLDDVQENIQSVLQKNKQKYLKIIKEEFTQPNKVPLLTSLAFNKVTLDTIDNDDCYKHFLINVVGKNNGLDILSVIESCTTTQDRETLFAQAILNKIVDMLTHVEHRIIPKFVPTTEQNSGEQQSNTTLPSVVESVDPIIKTPTVPTTERNAAAAIPTKRNKILTVSAGVMMNAILLTIGIGMWKGRVFENNPQAMLPTVITLSALALINIVILSIIYPTDKNNTITNAKAEQLTFSQNYSSIG